MEIEITKCLDKINEISEQLIKLWILKNNIKYNYYKFVFLFNKNVKKFFVFHIELFY